MSETDEGEERDASLGEQSSAHPGDRWLTYEGAGEALGVSAEAVRRRARREEWRRMIGNRGRALVLVPANAFPPWGHPPPRRPGPPTPGTNLPARALPGQPTPALLAGVEAQTRADQAALDAAARALTEVREALGRAESLAERLQEALAQERGLRERTEAERQQALQLMAEAQQRADRTVGENDGLKHGMEHMQEVMAQTRRDADEAIRRAEAVAQKAERKVVEVREELEKLRSRRLLARLLNRPVRE